VPCTVGADGVTRSARASAPPKNAARVAKVKAMFAEKRLRGEIAASESADETLDELEREAHAGRTVKLDLRLASGEKIHWAEAARALGPLDLRVPP
jgi:hypothetical protein